MIEIIKGNSKLFVALLCLASIMFVEPFLLLFYYRSLNYLLALGLFIGIPVVLSVSIALLFKKFKKYNRIEQLKTSLVFFIPLALLGFVGSNLLFIRSLTDDGYMRIQYDPNIQYDQYKNERLLLELNGTRFVLKLKDQYYHGEIVIQQEEDSDFALVLLATETGKDTKSFWIPCSLLYNNNTNTQVIKFQYPIILLGLDQSLTLQKKKYQRTRHLTLYQTQLD